MWSYYGAKTNIVHLYPRPKHDKIIEPFAGTARYALRYFDRDVLLIDSYEVIINIWKWLQSCSPNDILKLPREVKSGERIDQMKFDCEEMKMFFGFIVGCGSERPRMKATDRKTAQRPNHVNYNLQRVSKNLFKIKHWKFIHGSYMEAPDLTATWFIDPPYQFGGQSYVKKFYDFNRLKSWSMERKGQVIVCENTKADWMNFVPLKVQRGTLFRTTEAIWTNERTIYNNIQGTLF